MKLTVRSSGKNDWTLLLGGLVFVLAGIAILWLPPLTTRGRLTQPIAGWAAIVGFGFFAAIGARQLLRRPPCLVIDDAGISYLRGSPRMFPWDQIDSAKLQQNGTMAFLVLALRPGTGSGEPSPVSIQLAGLNRSPARIFDAVQKCLARRAVVKLRS